MSKLAPVYAPWDGRAAEMARDIWESDVTVRQWRNRENIPAKYWPTIIAKAAERGHNITAEQLLDLHKQRAA